MADTAGETQNSDVASLVRETAMESAKQSLEVTKQVGFAMQAAQKAKQA